MNPFDLTILSFLNRFAHRSPTFDEAVLLVSGNTLLKGGVVVAILWWIWFQQEDNQEKRESVLVAIVAGFLGLAISRILSWTIFRARPLNEPQLSFQLPYGSVPVGFEGASSFPSDHAVLFFALAAGLFLASRRVGSVALIYVALVICLPRVYLGVHYPTDILAGAALGIALAGMLHLPAIRKPITAWAFGWMDSAPGTFYACFFLLTYQIADLFNPLREIAGFFIGLYRSS